MQRKQQDPPLCQEDDRSDAAWYIPLQRFIHQIPSESSVHGSVWLHHLVSRAKNSFNGNKSPIKSPVRSPIKKTANLPATNPENPTPTANGQDKPLLELSEAERDMLKAVNFRKLTPGISKSQEFDTAKLRSIDESTCKLIKSNSHSPTTNTKNEFNGLRRHSTLPTLDFDINRTKALDVIDRVDNLRLL